MERRPEGPPRLLYTVRMALTLTSPAFGNGELIPSEHTCDGANTSPELAFSGVPEGTVSLAIIMDDPDIPEEVKKMRGIEVFDHWVLFNISPNALGITEGGTIGTPGVNGVGKTGYTGPCPPREYEPKEHRYFFRLYALDALLELPEESRKSEVLEAMEGHILAAAELMGRYSRAS